MRKNSGDPVSVKEVNMKTLSRFLAAVLMIASFSMVGSAYAQFDRAWDHHRGYYDRRGEVRQSRVYAGRVVAFDRRDHTLVIRGLEGERRFDMSRAQVTGVIRRGENVRVTYFTDRDGRMVASTVNGYPRA